MKAVAAAAMLALAVGIAGCGGGDRKAASGTSGKTYKVGIVQLVEHAALDAANKGFVDGMAGKGFKEGRNVARTRRPTSRTCRTSPSGSSTTRWT